MCWHLNDYSPVNFIVAVNNYEFMGFHAAHTCLWCMTGSVFAPVIMPTLWHDASVLVCGHEILRLLHCHNKMKSIKTKICVKAVFTILLHILHFILLVRSLPLYNPLTNRSPFIPTWQVCDDLFQKFKYPFPQVVKADFGNQFFVV